MKSCRVKKPRSAMLGHSVLGTQGRTPVPSHASGEGVTRFIAGSVDFGATDVLPSDVMLAGVKRGAIPVPVTAGMIVLAYNLPGLVGVLKLPRDVYSGIFSGRITQWNDPQIQK